MCACEYLGGRTRQFLAAHGFPLGLVHTTLTYGGATVGEFPTHVFPQWIRWFFIGVVPAGGAVYLPAVFALDAPNPMGVPQWAQVASPLVCVPVLLAAAGVWRLGLRRYESTGS